MKRSGAESIVMWKIVLAERMLLDCKERTLLVSRAFKVATIEVLFGYFIPPIESSNFWMIGQ